MIRVRTNASEVAAEIRIKLKGAADFRAVNYRLSVFLDQCVQRNFRQQGGFVGGWMPFKVYCVGGLRSPYNKTKTCGQGRIIGTGARRRLDTSAKLLQDTGVLRASFRPYYDEKKAGIESRTPYAEPHNEGAGPLPKRRMLPEVREIQKDIVAAYQQHLEKAIKK